MTENNTKPAVINVHSHGDIILDVGSGFKVRSIRVSSGVLTATSSFFVELFSANLRENAVPCTAADPKHVPMVDDEPEAVLHLCNLLHYRSEQVRLATGKGLLDLALLCDKYDCKAPVKLWMDSRIGVYFRSATKLTELWKPQSNKLPVLDVMGLAYLFDDSKHFWLASRPLIATIRLSMELRAILPAKLIEQLQLKRQTVMVEICQNAVDTVAAIFEYQSVGTVSLTAKGNGRRPMFCKPSLHKFAVYMGCLASVGLWPWRGDFTEDPSIEETLEQLAEVSRESRPGKCGARGYACGSCNLDVGVKLAEVVQKHKKNLTGLYLRCVKKRDYTDEAFRKTCPKHGLKMGE